jgi:hypothetical protein
MSFLAALTLTTILSLIASVRPLLAGCNDRDPGCWTPHPVPCSNASCVPFYMYPDQPAPDCADETLALYYSATANTSWYSCESVSNPNLPACTGNPSPCANVYLYSVSPCSDDNKCGEATIQRCLATVGNPC